LDTLRPDRFQALTRSGRHADVLRGIDAAGEAGFTGIKINTVAIRGHNDDELIDLIEFGRRMRAEVRFIEYMDVGGATLWSPGQVCARSDIIAALERHYGSVTPRPARDRAAPAEEFVLPDGTPFGIIA